MPAGLMNTKELLDATVSWAPAANAAASPTRAFLESSPTASMFLPAIDRARALLASLPAEGGELARLTNELVELDGRHDARGRFIVLVLQAYTHHPDEAIATKARDLLLLFFPDGLSFVNASYAEEAGLAVIRDELLTPARRAAFASFPTPGGGTLDGQLDLLQADARLIGVKINERAALGSDGSLPTPQAILDARRALIRNIQQVLSAWSQLDREHLLDGTAQNYTRAFRDQWNERVRTATANAAARRAAASDTTPVIPGTPVTPARS
ncbi:MAG: hypothetical protein U0234_10960 [Sandaracinus sp.]